MTADRTCRRYQGSHPGIIGFTDSGAFDSLTGDSLDQAATLRQAMERERERGGANIPGKGGLHNEGEGADVRTSPSASLPLRAAREASERRTLPPTSLTSLSQRNGRPSSWTRTWGSPYRSAPGPYAEVQPVPRPEGEKSLAETLVTGPGGMQVLPSSSGIAEMTELSRGQKLTLLDAVNSLKTGRSSC